MKRSCIVLVGLLVLGGCAQTVVRARTYPPGARITLNDEETCAPTPCDLAMYPTSALGYRVVKDGYLPATGTLEGSLAGGRLVGTILTFGLWALGDSLFYYPEDSIITVHPAVDPTADLDSITRFGNARVEGQAFTKTIGGELRYAAGNTISIRPDTLYVRDALYFRFYRPTGENTLTSKPNLTFLDTYVRTTTGDGNGRFAFDNLPGGNYILSATVTWHESSERGLVERRVDVVGDTAVREGETARVIVSDWRQPELPSDGQ